MTEEKLYRVAKTHSDYINKYKILDMIHVNVIILPTVVTTIIRITRNGPT